MVAKSIAKIYTNIHKPTDYRRYHTFVILFPISDSSGRDNPLEIYHIGYIFRTCR